MSSNDHFSPQLARAYENRDYYYKSVYGAEHLYSGRLGPKYARAVMLANSGSHPIKRILDIGCGRGELVNYYCSLGIEAVGIEYSHTACEIASELLAHSLHSGLGTILNIRDNVINYPDHYFDVVFMLEVVEHLYDGQLDDYYSQIRRLLCPGGMVVVHTWPNRLQRNRILTGYELFMRRTLAIPYICFFHKPIKQTLRDQGEELMHVNEHTPDQLRLHLRRHGFHVRIFTSYFAGTTPIGSSDFFGELVLNMGLLGLIPGIRKYLNRYIWAVATNPSQDQTNSRKPI